MESLSTHKAPPTTASGSMTSSTVSASSPGKMVRSPSVGCTRLERRTDRASLSGLMGVTMKASYKRVLLLVRAFSTSLLTIKCMRVVSTMASSKARAA
jgi:hypothetical protein